MDYGRGYILKDRIYPSITTVLGDQDKSSLDEWRKRVGEEEAERVSKRATIKGTAVHEMCELYLQNNLIDITKYSVIERESFLSLKPIIDKNIGTILAQETALYSHLYRIAGRVDLIAYFNGILSIIDFKTANKQKEKSWIHNYFVQETAYSLMLLEMKNIKIEQIVTLITVEFDEPQIFIENPNDYIKDFKDIRLNFFKKHGV